MTLATTGIEFYRRTPVVPTHVQVFGERSSGTNLVQKLLGANTTMQSVDLYGWKHGFAQTTGIANGALIVGVMREPVGWVRSMFAKPWHCPPAMQTLEFSDFIRAEWATIVDRPRYFGGRATAPMIGMPLQQDRHPLTGRPFANIAELRRFKAAHLLGWRNRGVNLVLVRLDVVQRDPEAFVVAVSEAFDLPVVETYHPVTRRLGSRFLPSVKDRPPLPDAISAADAAWLGQALDPALEAAMGFALPG